MFLETRVNIVDSGFPKVANLLQKMAKTPNDKDSEVTNMQPKNSEKKLEMQLYIDGKKEKKRELQQLWLSKSLM